jgi:hypothetical protein
VLILEFERGLGIGTRRDELLAGNEEPGGEEVDDRAVAAARIGRGFRDAVDHLCDRARASVPGAQLHQEFGGSFAAVRVGTVVPRDRSDTVRQFLERVFRLIEEVVLVTAANEITQQHHADRGRPVAQCRQRSNVRCLGWARVDHGSR